MGEDGEDEQGEERGGSNIKRLNVFVENRIDVRDERLAHEINAEKISDKKRKIASLPVHKPPRKKKTL